MKIALMSAMEEENQLLSKFLTNLTKTQAAGRLYTEGRYFDHDIVLAFSRWGKIASAVTATYLINHFKVDLLIFTGVAGSCCHDVKVGDIVIADKLIQHDMDARPLYNQFEIPLIGQTYFHTDPLLTHGLKTAAEIYMSSDKRLEDFDDVNSKVHQGVIASGDKFFSSKEDLKKLKNDIPSALCVEMEGASIAQVCFEHQIPYAVMRTISDSGDETAFRDFASFVKTVASPYSLGVLNHFLKSI